MTEETIAGTLDALTVSLKACRLRGDKGARNHQGQRADGQTQEFWDSESSSDLLGKIPQTKAAADGDLMQMIGAISKEHA